MASKLENLPILAIDYGKKRIGLAVSDRNGLVASALETVTVTRITAEDGAIEKIAEIIENYRIKSVLIGRPQAFEEGHREIHKDIEGFTERLRKRVDLPVTFIDESYTSEAAKSMLLSLGSRRKDRKNSIDKVAATLFLQQYLDNHQIQDD